MKSPLGRGGSISFAGRGIGNAPRIEDRYGFGVS
jgi:hypothetical protein